MQPTGRRWGTAKVGHAIQLGFDIDILEIHLNELCDVVDKFFILEFARQHNLNFPSKPLAWDHVKHQPRFEKVRDKGVHSVMGGLDMARTEQEDPNNVHIATVELLQERRRWEAIKDWNNCKHFFGPDDTIGFRDADEITSEKMSVLSSIECQKMED